VPVQPPERLTEGQLRKIKEVHSDVDAYVEEELAPQQ